MKHDLKAVCRHFQIPGDFVGGIPYGTGHINDTYAVTYRRGHHDTRYIVQRVNHNVFRNVPRLMENIQRVTEHIRRRLASQPGHDPARETLTTIPAVDGQSFHHTPEGDYWRSYVFIEGARTYDTVDTTQQAYEAARAFGTFQRLLLDLPEPRLHDTIPSFHHTPKRFQALEHAIEKDTAKRAATCHAEIRFAMDHKAMTSVLVDELAAGVLPERVTHNDTKLNNVMLEDGTGRGVCVIDLDTVMPGLVLYDFGDQVRTTTCTAEEDEKDLSLVRFRIELFEALVRGYLDTAGSFLAPAELDHLAFCGKLITFEIGIRFLADYLAGDVYFKVHRPGHNLDRARTQFARVRAMEAAEEQMEAIVARCRA